MMMRPAVALLALLVHPAEAADPHLMYEQMLAAPHVEGFWDTNPRVPSGQETKGAHHRRQLQGGKPPPPPSPGLHFSSVFSDDAVLQRAPAQAALYGLVMPAPPAGASVTVTVTPPLGGKSRFAATMAGGQGTWKVLLPPTEAGGDYSASAACSGCTNTSSVELHHLTFGDLWVCSGQVRAPARRTLLPPPGPPELARCLLLMLCRMCVDLRARRATCSWP